MEQVEFPFDHGLPNMVRTTRKANRKRLAKIAAHQRQPPVRANDRKFLPIVGVPASRAECPKERPCPYVRCEWHLARVDAENRAGRPGLAHVPRGAHGWTQAVTGDAGTERPGATLRPIWLDSERHCRAAIEVDTTGTICAINMLGDHHSPGTVGNADAVLAHMRLHEGEPLRVVSEDGTWATRATWRAGAIHLERAPLVGQVVAVLITRVRPVSSCGLDLIEQHGKLTNEQIGDAYGRHRTLCAREVKQALRKAIEEGERQGIEARDLLRALMEMGGK